jgi:hypothetical protein
MRRTDGIDSAALSLGRRREGLALRNNGAKGKMAELVATPVPADDILRLS